VAYSWIWVPAPPAPPPFRRAVEADASPERVEDLTETEIRLLHAHYQRLVTMAKRDASLTVSHSVEEADERHRTKTRHAEPVMGANPTRDAASPVGTPPG
jgi:hypothetical protein